jgi:hypothetical protein
VEEDDMEVLRCLGYGKERQQRRIAGEGPSVGFPLGSRPT